jgi:hypothetical protein
MIVLVSRGFEEFRVVYVPAEGLVEGCLEDGLRGRSTAAYNSSSRIISISSYRTIAQLMPDSSRMLSLHATLWHLDD